MQNRFDYISKHIGQRALGLIGTTSTQSEINAETLYADLRKHIPDPHARPSVTGWASLGGSRPFRASSRSTATLPAPRNSDLVWRSTSSPWQDRAREHRIEAIRKRAAEPFVDSALWIIAAGALRSLLAKLKLEGHDLTGRPASTHWR